MKHSQLKIGISIWLAGIVLGAVATALYLYTPTHFPSPTLPPGTSASFDIQDEATSTFSHLRTSTNYVHEKQKKIFQTFNSGFLENSRQVVLGGMLADGAEITADAMRLLLNMNCVFKIEIHVLLQTNQEVLYDLYTLMKDQVHPQDECADFHVSKQPAHIAEAQNRIDRLKRARDHQRAQIKGMMMDSRNLQNSVVVLADLDLTELPSAVKILEHVLDISNGNEWDVICSAGVVRNYGHEEEGYYDTFATVLLPDTFVYGIKGRENQQMRNEEDPNLVIGKGFTSVDLLNWFRDQGSTFEGIGTSMQMKPVPVKSCFGGLAIYRASSWFNEQCAYDMADAEGIKYANRFDHSPCEHVTFNNCLQRVDSTTTVAVQPDLRTRWQKPDTEKHRAIATNYAISMFPELEAGTKAGGVFSQKGQDTELEIDSRNVKSLREPREHQKSMQLQNSGNGVFSSQSFDQTAGAGSYSRLPRAIIHVGPRKTGSTAIQASIVKFSAQLQNDNYIHIASQVHLFSHCLVYKTTRSNWEKRCRGNEDVLAEMTNNITVARNENKNLIISSESLDNELLVDPDRLKDLLHGFDIHVVVTYRRFFEWIVSKFDETYRFGKQGDWSTWRSIPADAKNVVSFLSSEESPDYNHFYTPGVYRMYTDAGFQTHAINFHAHSDVVQEFFCLEELNTPSACKLALDSPQLAANKGESTAYDEIVVAAHDLGLFHGTSVSRPHAREALTRHMEKMVGFSEDKLPKVCASERVVQLLEQKSTETEESFFPDFYNSSSGKAELYSRLEEYKSTKLCAIDTKKILQEPGIVSFLSELGEGREDFPGSIAWLMSFPNSGTSYTLEMIQSLSGRAVATNYVRETIGKEPHAEQIAVFDEQPQGPFWLGEPFDRQSGEYLLTKTHCGSRCSGCAPRRFQKSVDFFKEECASDGGKGAKQYPFDHVQKAVHLIRDPFDNVVSRFHLKLRNSRTRGAASGSEAFRTFCFEENENMNDNGILDMYLSQEQLAKLHSVPCRAEFFKYVMWHNKAFETSDMLNLDMLVIHYSWYATSFTETTLKIANFLGMKKTSDPAPFVTGKVYSEYFTGEERLAVSAVLQSLASGQTWEEIKDYFAE